MIPGNANPLLLASAAAAGDTEFSIQKSVRFNDGDSAHFTRTPSAASNRRTFTWSGWFKRSTIDGTHTLFAAGSDANNRFALRFSSGQLFIVDQVGGGSIIRNRTEQQFRDVSSWYHFVVAIDSTQSTSSDRLKMYVNGSVVEDYDITNYPSQNQQFHVNSTDEHYIGKRVAEAQYFDGYIANVHFIDGLGLAASDFGFYDDNNVWRPKNYTGTFGTNGFHLFDFANESTLGHDSSGNNNDWTANNFSTSGGATDILFDSPTNGDQSDTGAGGEVSGNYAVWNALGPGGASTYATLSNGNLEASLPASGRSLFQTIFPESGKWYVEIKFVSGGGAGGGLRIGVINENNINKDLGSTADSWAYLADGRVYHNGSAPSYGVSSSPGDLLMIALDIDAGKLWYGNDGTWMASGDPANGNNPSQTFTAGQKMSFSAQSGSGTVQVVKGNWGQRAWTYTAPSGFKAVCTANLATPTIADGSAYFDTKLYTGNGSTQTVSGLNMSPDLVWMKTRSQANDHVLVDSVRGVGVRLFSNDSIAENTQSTSLTSFNSDGFSLGSHSSVNQNNVTHVAWAWDAGTSTVSNTDGSVTTSVRASATSGFSIVTYTGNGTDDATFGHGLSASPEMIWVKRRDSADDWFVYSLPTANNILKLNSTDPQGSSSHFRTMSSSTFQLSGNADVNANNGTFVAYCISPVAGYSAVGSYEGNASSTEGPFIQTGFKVAFLLVKSADSSFDWFVYDTTRQTYNVYGPNFRANRNYAEQDDDRYDLLSNGFKVRTSSIANNANSTTYIYAAFAENPFQANGGLAR